MKLIPICNCKDDKVITGQMDGEMIFREKDFFERSIGRLQAEIMTRGVSNLPPGYRLENLDYGTNS